MRIEIVYMDRNKDAEEYECDYISSGSQWLYLTNVVYPFEASKLSINLDKVDYFVEYEEEE